MAKRKAAESEPAAKAKAKPRAKAGTSKASASKASASKAKKATAAKVAAPTMEDLRNLTAATPAALLVIDADARVLFATEAAAARLERTDLVGSPCPVDNPPTSPLTWRKQKAHLIDLGPAGESSAAQPQSADVVAELQAQLADAQSTITRYEWQLELAAARREEADAELERCQDLETRLAQAERERSELLETAPDPGRLAELEAELDRRAARVAELEAELDRRAARGAELEGELDRRATRVAELEGELDRHATRVAELEGEAGRAAEREAEHQRNAARVAELEAELDRREARVAELEGELDRRAARVAELEGELDRRAARVAELEAESDPPATHQDLELRLAQSEERAQMLQRELDQARTRLDEVADQAGAAPTPGSDLTALQAEVESLAGECRRLRAHTVELEAELAAAAEFTAHLQAQAQPTAPSLPEEFERGVAELVARVEQLESQLQAEADRREHAEKALQDLRGRRAEAETTVSVRRYQGVRARAEALESELAAQLNKIQELERQTATGESAPGPPATPPTPAAAPPRAPLYEGPTQLLYQPIFTILSGKLAGVEALLCTSEGQPIPAEQVPLNSGYQALIAACQQAATWRAQGLQFALSFDASAELLCHPDLPVILGEALQLAGLPPDALILELPSQSGSPDGRLETVLQLLSQASLPLALDGVGAGNACFAHLAYARLLKITPQLVGQLPQPAAVSATKAVLGLARGRGLAAIGVGVGNEAQFRWLRNANCEMAQGSHLCPPVGPEAIPDYAQWGRLVE